MSKHSLHPTYIHAFLRLLSQFLLGKCFLQSFPFDKMTIEICVSAYPQTFSEISLLLGVEINKDGDQDVW